jgi:hypothetical protein
MKRLILIGISLFLIALTGCQQLSQTPYCIHIYNGQVVNENGNWIIKDSQMDISPEKCIAKNDTIIELKLDTPPTVSMLK